jgi:hypothetical protein
MKFPTLFESPFFTFCIPPALAVGQFLVSAYLFSNGFPHTRLDQTVYEGLLVTLLFSLCLLPILGMGLGLRQVMYGHTKAISALGVAFNGLYFMGCVLFFVLVFVTNSTH